MVSFLFSIYFWLNNITFVELSVERDSVSKLSCFLMKYRDILVSSSSASFKSRLSFWKIFFIFSIGNNIFSLIILLLKEFWQGSWIIFSTVYSGNNKGKNSSIFIFSLLLLLNMILLIWSIIYYFLFLLFYVCEKFID